jgi:hypothetical protein
MTITMKTLTMAGAAATMLTTASAVHAQLASPSAAAFAMGDNYTALARGYNAVSWNPAGLGMSGNPGFSLTVGSARGIAGLDPVTLSDLKEYEGQVVPTSVKQQWLNSIIEEESQAGTGGADLTWLALQIGPVALQAATSGRAVNNISPGVAQLIMFGNADDTGPQAITLSGSAVDVNSYSTFAASFGMPFSIGMGSGRLAAGATVKYTVGHVLAFGRESTGATTTEPIAVNFSFPIVHTPLGDDDESFEVNNGNGFGIDIGVGYEDGPLTLAATVQNVFNTFEWDDTALRYRPLSIMLEQGSYETETDVQPIATAPQSVRNAIDDMTFKPSVALGAAFRQSARLNIAADARFGGSDGMHTRPPTHVGAGVEYAATSFLPVRVGVAYVKVDDENSGFQFGAGFGIRFGNYSLSAGIGQVNTDLGKDTHLMLQVVSIGM